MSRANSTAADGGDGEEEEEDEEDDDDEDGEELEADGDRLGGGGVVDVVDGGTGLSVCPIITLLLFPVL